MLQLQSTSEVNPVNHCLIYGKAKSGKTRLIPTAPNPIICSTDEGLASIRQFNIPFFSVKTYADYLRFEKAAFAGEFAKFQTLVIDDLTELTEIFLTVTKPKHKNLMQAYGELNDEVMRLIRVWRSQTALTVVFICKQERIKDESTGGLIYAPAIPGKAVAPMLPYLLGSVYHMEQWTDPTTQKTYDCLRTKQNNQFEAGDRSGKLSELEVADLSQIFKKTLS